MHEKDNTIQEMREKYDEDISLLKEAILDMQQLLKNPLKLAELSQSTGLETLG